MARLLHLVIPVRTAARSLREVPREAPTDSKWPGPVFKGLSDTHGRAGNRANSLALTRLTRPTSSVPNKGRDSVDSRV